MDAGGRGPNATFILNTIDYLNGREDIAVMRAKVQRFNPVEETQAGTKTFVKAANIAGLPVWSSYSVSGSGSGDIPAKNKFR